MSVSPRSRHQSIGGVQPIGGINPSVASLPSVPSTPSLESGVLVASACVAVRMSTRRLHQQPLGVVGLFQPGTRSGATYIPRLLTRDRISTVHPAHSVNSCPDKLRVLAQTVYGCRVFRWLPAKESIVLFFMRNTVACVGTSAVVTFRRWQVAEKINRSVGSHQGDEIGGKQRFWH